MSCSACTPLIVKDLNVLRVLCGVASIIMGQEPHMCAAPCACHSACSCGDQHTTCQLACSLTDLAAKGKALHTQLNDALRIVEDLQTSLNGSSCLKWCWNWCSHKAAVDAAKDALENVNRAADDYIVVVRQHHFCQICAGAGAQHMM